MARLWLSRPNGYGFRAGQWFRLTLPAADGENTKTFSHASAPADERLEMATRLSGSAFKDALAALRPGDEVVITGPGGRLALPSGIRRVVFLTGGVGVTPVRSILRDVAAQGSVFDDALVVYGNRDPECVLYLDELEAMGAAGVRVVPVFEWAPDSWHGERGLIDAALVRRHARDRSVECFLVTGPPSMVGAMERVLDELSVAVSARLVERFGTQPVRGRWGISW